MKVSIIGCGWLGLPLGKSLVKTGHQVIGSTTRQEKFKTIEAEDITPVLMELIPTPTGLNFNSLFDAECVIINIPPKKNDATFYEEQIKYLRHLIDQHQVPKIIYISSTSYYPNTMKEVNESTPYDFKKGSKKVIVQAEKQIRQTKSNLTVLRCGGLIGEDRIPGKWTEGKEVIGANTPVNYIHQNDVIGIIMQLLQNQDLKLDTLNLVSPEHPTKKEVYEAMAKKHNLLPTLWKTPEITPYKIVSSKINEALKYNFQYPDPLNF